VRLFAAAALAAAFFVSGCSWQIGGLPALAGAEPVQQVRVVEAAPLPPVRPVAKPVVKAEPVAAPAPAAAVLPAFGAAAPAPAPVVNVTVPEPSVTVAPANVTVKAAEESNTKLAVNYGSWLISILTFLGGFAFTLSRLATGLISNPLVRMMVESYLTETKVREMVNLAIAKTEGASQGMVLNVDVGNKIAAEVGQMALTTLPGIVIGLLGGEAGLREKAISMLNLAPEASAATLAA
jgi:hypothetical protein